MRGGNCLRGCLVCAAALALAGAAGCTTTSRQITYQRPIRPKPRPLQPAPADAEANALVLNVASTPVDTNRNGYPDLIYATAFLFDTRYPPAIHEEGAFVLSLYAPGQAGSAETPPLQEWRVEGDEQLRSRGASAFGECYRFRLSLLEEDGTDLLPVTSADIVARFEPADGRAPTYSQVASIKVGQHVLVPKFEWAEEAPPEPATDLRAWP